MGSTSTKRIVRFCHWCLRLPRHCPRVYYYGLCNLRAHMHRTQHKACTLATSEGPCIVPWVLGQNIAHLPCYCVQSRVQTGKRARSPLNSLHLQLCPEPGCCDPTRLGVHADAHVRHSKTSTRWDHQALGDPFGGRPGQLIVRIRTRRSEGASREQKACRTVFLSFCLPVCLPACLSGLPACLPACITSRKAG